MFSGAGKLRAEGVEGGFFEVRIYILCFALRWSFGRGVLRILWVSDSIGKGWVFRVWVFPDYFGLGRVLEF